MATLKYLSAVTRKQVATAVRVNTNTVLDSPAGKLYPILVSRHVSQDAAKTVWRSSVVLHHYHFKSLNRPQPCTLKNNFGRNHAASSHSNTYGHQYICPSRLDQLFSQLVIMDKVTDVQSHYDCPLPDSVNISKVTPASQGGKADILEPPDGGRITDSKEAKEIMRIRHKKMKKHKLRKLRKRMFFLWRKQKAARKAKRNAIYWREIADIKQEAEDFSAEAFVKEQLEKARKGGFYVKVLDSKV